MGRFQKIRDAWAWFCRSNWSDMGETIFVLVWLCAAMGGASTTVVLALMLPWVICVTASAFGWIFLMEKVKK